MLLLMNFVPYPDFNIISHPNDKVNAMIILYMSFISLILLDYDERVGLYNTQELPSRSSRLVLFRLPRVFLFKIKFVLFVWCVTGYIH